MKNKFKVFFKAIEISFLFNVVEKQSEIKRIEIGK